VAGGLATLLASVSAPAESEVLNKVVLRVNDQIATLYDFQLRRADAIGEIMRRIHDPKEQKDELAQVSENVFRDMFQELLLSSRADQLAVEATDAEVDDAIANVRKNFGIKTDAEFQQALTQNGMTLEQMRAQTRKRLRIQGVMSKEVQAKIKVKDEDTRRYYRKNEALFRVPEQVQLREVVVLEDSGLPAAERNRIAVEIRAAVAGGKTLAEAVAPYAAKSQTSSVVELGWVSPKDLDPKLEETAWKLSANGVSEPVDARGGLHLLQLIDRHPAHLKPFVEVQAQITQQEQERLFRDESIKYMADLEARSLVVADPPREAANFRRKMGVAEDPAIQGLNGASTSAAGTPAAPGATKEAPAAPATAGSLDQVVPQSSPLLDTTDKKKDQGGLPAPEPAGEAPADKVKIPPPSPATTPVPPPAGSQNATTPPPSPATPVPPPSR
jgi:peptidyl-prolyl cis-trans isomerase SurA